MMLKFSELEDIFLKRSVLKRGHFLLTSGLHSDTYFEKFRILEDPEFTNELISLRMDEIRALKPEITAGPTTGGVIVAYQVALLLKIKAIYAERGVEGRVLRRGFKIEPAQRVIIADDVLTTGGSVKDVINLVEERGGKVVGVFVIIDRSEEIKLDIPVISVYKQKVLTFPPVSCPLCKEDIPLETPGGVTTTP